MENIFFHKLSVFGQSVAVRDSRKNKFSISKNIPFLIWKKNVTLIIDTYDVLDSSNNEFASFGKS